MPRSPRRPAPGRRPSPARRFRPRLDGLEARALLTTFSVTNTADSGPGSLRQAILNANAAPDRATIRFSIPATDPGFIDVDAALPGGDAAPDVFVIRPTSPLPDLNNAAGGIVLDASTQAAFGNTNPFGPEVVLDGRYAGTSATPTVGLRLLSSDSRIAGLDVINFGGDGIQVFGSRNVVVGNYVGVDATGTTAAPNASGIVVLGTSNTIGNATVGDPRNVIAGNLGPGVYLAGGAWNYVYGNYIGTDAAGSRPVGNGADGVYVGGDSADTTVESNVIAANGGQGVRVAGGTARTMVESNAIGTNSAGASGLGNGADGVYVGGDSADTTVRGNVVAANGGRGVRIVAPATRTKLFFNFIGVWTADQWSDVRTPLGNAHEGVLIQDASGNFITNNLISANRGDGLVLTAGSSGNEVLSNTIGQPSGGTAALGNGGNGVVVYGPNNQIGAYNDHSYAGNVISGNAARGVWLTGSAAVGNRVQVNRIGTDGNGTTALGNGYDGISVDNGATGNIIGTDGDGVDDNVEGNFIDFNGNNNVGLWNARDTVIAGNMIGTDGSSGQGARYAGIWVGGGSTGTRIGTDADGRSDDVERNWIAGNGGDGVVLTGAGTSGNTVAGNYIGTDLIGAGPLANQGSGVVVSAGASGNTIGGTAVAARNVISGNAIDGVILADAGTTSNVVAGNYIGTDRKGAAKLPNQGNGVTVANGAASNAIGGAAGARNVISGNRGAGVFLVADAASNLVQGNYIGTDQGGTRPLGNAGRGVDIEGRSVDNTVLGNVLADNGGEGVAITGNAERRNAIRSNLIGTDWTGLAPLGNHADGVIVFGDSADTTIAGNTISANGARGVRIIGPSTRTTLTGNTIGLGSDGRTPLGNAFEGILVQDASGNTIGGTTDAARNVISGNGGDGVGITAGGSNNAVLGNYVGTTADGLATRGNGGQGVAVFGPNNTVGGGAASAGNVIAGNAARGVWVSGSAAVGDRVQGNAIGSDKDKLHPLGNGYDGVSVDNGASATVVGTDGDGVNDAAEGNTIVASGNNNVGLWYAANTVIAGNKIGTNGTAAMGAAGAGVWIGGGSTGTRIGTNADGTSDDLESNLIAGNRSDGVVITGAGTNGNVVAGNWIGLDSTGAGALRNLGNGLIVSAGAASNTIGGTAAAARNVISGNSGSGVDLRDAGTSGNTVAGNVIGLATTGLAPQGNFNGGVRIELGASGNTVGGTVAGARNTISGNGAWGVMIINGSSGNLVAGNYVGTGAGGTGALGNQFQGIAILDASNNTIGGAAPLAGNVIAGNRATGLSIGAVSGNATGNVVLGNRIGVDANDAPAANAGFGIAISSAGGGRLALGNLIGGPAPGATNIIASNTAGGVVLNGAGTTGNTLANNVIRGNGGDGVRISVGASSNIIGAPLGDVGRDAAGNVISGNAGAGVAVVSGVGNSLLSNRISANAQLGIDLGGDGITPNHDGGPLAGPNGWQDAPELSAARFAADPNGGPGGSTTITGRLVAAPGTTYVVQFFASVAPDPLGFGQGETYLGSQSVTTGPDGSATVTATLPTGDTTGAFVSATATAPDGSTSEFAADVAVNPPVLAPIADQAVDEGRLLAFTASATVAGAAGPVVYSLDPGAPAGASIDPDSGAFRWTPARGPATASITVRATLKGHDLVSDARTFHVSVRDVAPTVTLGGDLVLNAATSRRLSEPGRFDDPGLATWSATVNYGDGNGPVALALNADGTFRLDHAYAMDGQYLVLVRVTDDGGASGTAAHLVTVDTTPPRLASIAGASPVARNVPVDSVDATFSEPIDPATLDASDLALTVNGVPVALGSTVTIAPVGGTSATYRIGGLRGLSAGEGAYALRIDAAGIADPAGNPGANALTTNWLMDLTPPTSLASPLPRVASSYRFVVGATGSDPAHGGSPASGLASLALYVSDNGAPFAYWATQAPGGPAPTFNGQPGHTYTFRSVATDAAGNVEAKLVAAEASTYVPDLTPPTTAVTSAVADPATALFTLNVGGGDAGGSGLASFRVYAQVDGGAPAQVATLAAGLPDGAGRYAVAASFQAPADGLAHTYRFTSVGLDGNGNVEPAHGSADVTVTTTFQPQPLVATRLLVQQGARTGRSFVRFVDVDFNEGDMPGQPLLSDLIGRGGITLIQHDLNNVSVVKTWSTADLIARAGLAASGQRISLDFGPYGLGGQARGTGTTIAQYWAALAAGDGYYEVALDLGGGRAQSLFFGRLLGDVNGDGVVDGTRADHQGDLDLITAALGQSSGASGLTLNADVNGDGVVDTMTDKQLASRSVGRRLKAGLRLDA